jgi:hypothetical protein
VVRDQGHVKGLLTRGADLLHSPLGLDLLLAALRVLLLLMLCVCVCACMQGLSATFFCSQSLEFLCRTDLMATSHSWNAEGLPTVAERPRNGQLISSINRSQVGPAARER